MSLENSELAALENIYERLCEEYCNLLGVEELNSFDEELICKLAEKEFYDSAL